VAKINLLPWREELREQRQREFISVSIGVVIVAAGLLYLAHLDVSSDIDAQIARNNLISKEIKLMAESVKEIDALKAKKEELLARMNVIQSLQGNRPIIVRVFDELVRTIPEGVFYTKLSREQNAINFEGTAESNNRVSSLMRKLDLSEWFTKPNLTSVSANPDFGPQANSFKMTVEITTPPIEKDGEEAADGA
jgi:type IV pilus assembly protein PilN